MAGLPSAPPFAGFPAPWRSLHHLPEWQAFVQAAQAASLPVNELCMLSAGPLAIDISAQRRSAPLAQAGQALLHTRGLHAWREALFSGAPVNLTEHRGAWHTALRASSPPPEVARERERVLEFVKQADLSQRWRNVVHIGIGGSDWGVRLATRAFGYHHLRRKVRYVSNIDGHAIQGGLAGLDPRDTLIVLASKSFTTAETLQNGQRAVEWLRASGIADPYQHIAAITACPERAEQWGVPATNIFRFWDWVGGRFSMWSAVSLTTALAVGPAVVNGMLAGAAAIDDHFLHAPFAQNAPVQLALIGIVNRSVLGHQSLNIAPYDFRLANLVPYLQQLDMESLGKSVDLSGEPLQVCTGPVVWGMPGTDAQHTFFQWLHQGCNGTPVDFIVCQKADHGWPGHHHSLLANCLAQREALLKGKSYHDALQECLSEGLSADDAASLAHHRVHPGGRPSTLIVLPQLTPEALGALVALYEHKTFVQGVVWGINPFDQWGVEYGKVLARGIQETLAGKRPLDTHHDPSTAHWIRVFRGDPPAD